MKATKSNIMKLNKGIELYELTILEHLLCYFVNRDIDNYSADEIESLIHFENNLLQNAKFMTVEIVDSSENYSKCEILNIFGKTITANFYVQK